MMKAKAFPYIGVILLLLITLPLVPQVWADELKHTTLKVEGWA